MRISFLVTFLLCAMFSLKGQSFKANQKKYKRVREAYVDKESSLMLLCEKQEIDIAKLRIYIRVFKQNERVELWGRNKEQEKYKLLTSYKICSLSGGLGPKRRQGDGQIPEGFYHIDRFNPFSNFYLSLGINYPNRSDKVLGTKGNLGGDIFIHGSCVTIGCVPIKDEWIKELYIACIEAKNAGQKSLPVTIFPVSLTEENYARLKKKYAEKPGALALWKSLKEAYVFFQEKKSLPRIRFVNDGQHEVY